MNNVISYNKFDKYFFLNIYTNMKFKFSKINDFLPEFNGSNWLIRIPLSIVFIQQGFSKLPIDLTTAESYGLNIMIWKIVIFSEIFSGIGLLLGGIFKKLAFISIIGDLLTRFCGATIAGIITGVILISKHNSFLDIILYDQFHLMLCCGGLFFFFRGNRVR